MSLGICMTGRSNSGRERTGRQCLPELPASQESRVSFARSWHEFSEYLGFRAPGETCVWPGTQDRPRNSSPAWRSRIPAQHRPCRRAQPSLPAIANRREFFPIRCSAASGEVCPGTYGPRSTASIRPRGMSLRTKQIQRVPRRRISRHLGSTLAFPAGLCGSGAARSHRPDSSRVRAAAVCHRAARQCRQDRILELARRSPTCAVVIRLSRARSPPIVELRVRQPSSRQRLLLDQKPQHAKCRARSVKRHG